MFMLRLAQTFGLLIGLSALLGAVESKERDKAYKWICTPAPTSLCIVAGDGDGDIATTTTTAAKSGDVRRFESQHDCRLSCGNYGSIWPAPNGECHLGDERVRFDPWKVRFNVVAPDDVTTQLLRETNRVFVSNIIKECLQNCTLAPSKEVLVKAIVNSSRLVLDWNTDESYTLTVSTKEIATFIDIRAQTVYGVRHAFETLSNLVTGSLNGGLLMVSHVHIYDSPAYMHRGLLLDTARNYVPIRYIRSTLDAMAASKLNVLHWHVVDTQSFPLEITRVPEMQSNGAYSAQQVYTRRDTQNIIKYARLRGIRVLIEIDGPSHAGNGWQWGVEAGLGNLSVCINRMPWRSYCVQPPCGQLNPANKHMYAIIREIYEDIAEVNPPEETIHMGGDEVHLGCWNSTDEIRQHLQQRGLDLSAGSFHKLWAEFHAQNLLAWDEVNGRRHGAAAPKPVIIWSSQLTLPNYIETYLPKERYVVQTWVPKTDTLDKELLRRGYRIIVSTKDAWYLDHGFLPRTQYHTWVDAYENQMPNARPGQVLGGEACMWTEYVDQNSLEPRIWPRAGAVAERLWSNLKTRAVVAQSRFYRYRDRLVARGIHPDAVAPRWCVLNEGQCL